jgi:hypothetical protein
MSETPDSDYRQVSVPDEDLPDDLKPGEDNPLAEASDDDAERQDLGDPHIEGLQGDDGNDEEPVPADTDARDQAHHGAQDSED